MKKDAVYWIPRVLSVLFVLFLMLFSLDVFEPGLTAWQIALGLLMHNIPALIVLVFVIIAWKKDFVGMITFVVAGLLYIALVITTAIRNGFEGYYLSWSLTIAGPAFVVAFLYYLNWKRKKK